MNVIRTYDKKCCLIDDDTEEILLFFDNFIEYSRPDNYIGKTYDNSVVVYNVCSYSDDDEKAKFMIIQNFISIYDYSLWDSHVEITRAFHWLVGWIDTIRVYPSSPLEFMRQLDYFIGG
jgi:hypothetical protein